MTLGKAREDTLVCTVGRVLNRRIVHQGQQAVTSHSRVSICHALTTSDLAAVRRLFLEYREHVREPRCFESFAKEIANLRGDYGGPSGCLLIAWHDTGAIGCVPLLTLGNGSAEAKRLYVISDQCRHGVEKALMLELISYAGAREYDRLQLETLPEMVFARKLYRTMVFHETGSVELFPVPGALGLEVNLSLV